MDYEPLVEDKINAGRAFLQEFNRVAPVKAACWVKGSEANRWFLFIASDSISEDKIRDGYGQVIAILGKNPSLFLESTDIKLITVDHPLVKDVYDLYRKYPAPGDTWYRGPMFGGMGTDNVFIYAPKQFAPLKARSA